MQRHFVKDMSCFDKQIYKATGGWKDRDTSAYPRTEWLAMTERRSSQVLMVCSPHHSLHRL